MSTPINRRAALGALASVPALAIPAAVATAAAPVDPVYAAIARHRTAFAAFVETIDDQDEVCARQNGREVAQAHVDAHAAAGDAEDEALEAFLSTVPTTLAGVRAALAYAVEIDRDCMPECGGSIAPALLASPIFAA